MNDDEDIQTMFYMFQVLISGLQVMNKSYTRSNHVNKILRILPARYRPKATTIQEAKYLNTLSLEIMIRNLHRHEMKMNGDEPMIKSKSMALKSVAEKSGGKAVRSLKVWKSEEAYDDEAFEGDYDDKEMYFIFRGFQQLTKRNKIFSSRCSGFRGSSSKDKTDNQKNCFNCKKPVHFQVDCPGLQKDKPKK